MTISAARLVVVSSAYSLFLRIDIKFHVHIVSSHEASRPAVIHYHLMLNNRVTERDVKVFRREFQTHNFYWQVTSPGIVQCDASILTDSDQ